MNMNTESNENWGTCPKCGEPVLIDPNTGKMQPCATCASLADKPGIAMRAVWIIGGLVAIVALVYLCIRILL